MTNLAANTLLVGRQLGQTMSFEIEDEDTIYLGMLAGIDNTSKHLSHWDDGASSVFLGVVVRADSRLNDGVFEGEASDTPPPEATVNISGYTFEGLTAVGGSPTGIGQVVYCVDSNPANMTVEASGKNHIIGIITRFTSATDLDVTLLPFLTHVAQANA